MNALTAPGSLMPPCRRPSTPRTSTPPLTSTAQGRTRRTASATLAGSRPPASTSGRGGSAGSRSQSNRSPVPPGTPGKVYFSGRPEFAYHNEPDKTASSYLGEKSTLGDIGYVDDDGYLFLTGRTAELIISGGVNIYPVEVDNELLKHPGVQDACTYGAPNEEWGEEVRCIVKPTPEQTTSQAFEQELHNWLRERLAGFKCPRKIDFVTEVPRSDAGKVQRKQVRDEYGRAAI